MTNSKNNFFSVIRPGTNTTYQDLGRKNLNHIGLPVGGAMDIRNYKLANSLLSDDNETLIEFAYQGPLLKFHGKEAKFAITGNVNFNIIIFFSNYKFYISCNCAFNIFTKIL